MQERTLLPDLETMHAICAKVLPTDIDLDDGGIQVGGLKIFRSDDAAVSIEQIVSKGRHKPYQAIC
jgi:hypothetical protein